MRNPSAIKLPFTVVFRYTVSSNKPVLSGDGNIIRIKSQGKMIVKRYYGKDIDEAQEHYTSCVNKLTNGKYVGQVRLVFTANAKIIREYANVTIVGKEARV